MSMIKQRRNKPWLANIKIKALKRWKNLPRFVYVLAVIAALGMSAGLYRLYAGLGATTNLSTVFPWGLWISFDLTNVAFSGAAFTLAMLVYVFHMHELHPAIRPTVLFGFLGYSSVLVILFFDQAAATGSGTSLCTQISHLHFLKSVGALPFTLPF